MNSKQKNTFFSRIRLFKPKNWEEKGKNCQNPSQAIIRLKKKVELTTKPLV